MKKRKLSFYKNALKDTERDIDKLKTLKIKGSELGNTLREAKAFAKSLGNDIRKLESVSI